jgi:hypothetical protein
MSKLLDTLTTFDTTDSTDTDTGALVVAGGVGIAKSINIGENATIANLLTLGSGTSSYSFPLVVGGLMQVAS